MSNKKAQEDNKASNEKGEVKVSMKKSKVNPAVRNFIIVIVGIVLILCLCLSAYLIDMYRKNAQKPVPQDSQTSNQINKNNDAGSNGQTTSDTNTGAKGSESAIPQTSEGTATPAPQPAPAPSISSEAASTVNTGHSPSGYQKFTNNLKDIENTGVWKATQYSQGDIVSHTYVVQRGDTLWQIAKAYYGSGTQWKKILNANSNKIGFLKNGQQALIFPNQVLNLP
jgi:nucleoid-associated protein YgaU